MKNSHKKKIKYFQKLKYTYYPQSLSLKTTYVFNPLWDFASFH